VKVFQIGAAGGVGRRLTELLVARGEEVTGMHRAPAQAEVLRACGAAPVAVSALRLTARPHGAHRMLS
jgi:uncharacterized protein YbjT (DUF2867 family)